MLRRWMQAIVILTASGLACAQTTVPVVRGILNNAGYDKATIAQGSIVAIFGEHLGPENLVQVSSFPISVELGGTSVTIFSGREQYSALLLYTSRTQVGIVIPSKVPAGTATLGVTYQGQTSNRSRFEVAQHGFGTFAVNQAGFGPAVAQNVIGEDRPLNSTAAPARPGQLMVLWGTGLGSVSGNEAAGPLPGDLMQFETRVRFRQIYGRVVYAGRSGCCTGLDQVVVEVPRGSLGCSVPMVVEVKGQPGNMTTVAVTEDGRPCVEAPSSFSASLSAAPSSGPAPLVVRFTSEAAFSEGAVVRYRYDLNGDGIWEQEDVGALNPTFTYQKAGVYRALLEIENERGVKARDIEEITVTGHPPKASVKVTPTNGPAPLTVRFEALASDPEGGPVQLAWDFNGDGVDDVSSSGSGVVEHTYTDPNVYVARFRVTDIEGLHATVPLSQTTIRVAPSGSPIATITSPAASSFAFLAPRTVSLAGRGTDADGKIVLYEWDFDGNGEFEHRSETQPSVVHEYRSPGLRTVAFRVTDNEGKTGIATVDLDVTMNVTLDVTSATVRPIDAQLARIVTQLAGDTRLHLLIVDSAGKTVKTVFAGERAAGKHEDTWDSRDEQGDIVPGGLYYAVLRYGPQGQERVLDLTRTTGGRQSVIAFDELTSTQGGCRSPCRFDPFKDDFLRVRFTLRSASELTISVRSFSTAEEIVRLVSRAPFGAGEHTVFWDGTDQSGQIVQPPPGENLLFTLVSYELPENAIVVETAPQITDLRVTPNIFDPSAPPADPNAGSVNISFRLTRPGAVTMQVISVRTGLVLRTLELADFAEGERSFAWDGRTAEGALVDSGSYRVMLQAFDSRGSKSVLRSFPLRVIY